MKHLGQKGRNVAYALQDPGLVLLNTYGHGNGFGFAIATHTRSYFS